MVINHVGIAVKSIAAARTSYETLGLKIEREQVIPHEQVKIAFVRIGESLLELLEPTEENSTIGRFLESRGEGLHHLALEADDIEATLQRLKNSGVRLVNENIQTGADGHRYFFIHPTSSGGVLLEIVERTEIAQLWKAR